ncbi:MAG: hypothetical protein K2Q09_04600 [Phycisphaerales bacterium]|nr:hypothetical protein [Phycisphaerales bacterium]
MTRGLAEGSNKRNVSLSVLMDAQLQRYHKWQSREKETAMRLGPMFALSNSDFGWLHALCDRGALEHAWNLLQVGLLRDAKRATWIRFPPLHAGLNAPRLKIGNLLWDTVHAAAYLAVAIVQSGPTQQGYVACLRCIRNQATTEARLFASAVFLIVQPSDVQLFTLDQCQNFRVGSATPVFWKRDMLLAIDNGLLPDVPEVQDDEE